MRLSRNAAVLLGVVTAAVAAAAVWTSLLPNPFVAGGVGLFAGVSVACSLWGIPRLNDRIGDPGQNPTFAAATGGVAGGLAALAMFPAVFVDGVSFPVGMALGAHAVLVGLAGLSGMAVVVVLRLDRADAEVAAAQQ